MIQVNGTVRLKEEPDDATLHALITMIEASRTEAGCLYYSYARDLIDRHVIVILEQWRDQAALDFHFATPHMADFRGFLGRSGVVQQMDVRVYESDEGHAL